MCALFSLPVNPRDIQYIAPRVPSGGLLQGGHHVSKRVIPETDTRWCPSLVAKLLYH